ncbi:hypothetical protein BRW65_03910 [Mycobacterium paraffinicum]|uniref:Uncharacterized protein n=1 Tax=Mycobacterium paraffinicum TaxID=53378 RepID=A0A1Q4I1C5_9MYCO|nr:hypothetical protein [Mycobacterium paraffinicum]OJZ75690.1 hypothetical protein BRW65_03910 [Mycobacterium paraffinicum]
MRLNGIGNMDFAVKARDNADAALLQLSIGPLQFTLTESEGLRLSNRLVDAIEHHRRHRGAKEAGQ